MGQNRTGRRWCNSWSVRQTNRCLWSPALRRAARSVLPGAGRYRRTPCGDIATASPRLNTPATYHRSPRLGVLRWPPLAMKASPRPRRYGQSMMSAIAAWWLRQRSGRPSQIPRLLDASWENLRRFGERGSLRPSLSRTATRACELPHISRSGVYPDRQRALRSRPVPRSERITVARDGYLAADAEKTGRLPSLSPGWELAVTRSLS